MAHILANLGIQEIQHLIFRTLRATYSQLPVCFDVFPMFMERIDNFRYADILVRNGFETISKIPALIA